MAPAKGQSYTNILTAAIDDMVANGYDSPERVAHWMSELRRAADRTMRTTSQVEQDLRNALLQVYRRMIENGGIAQFHQGVGRFTVEKLRPQLRAELDRRIVASLGLIRLNREDAVQKSQRRFSGWATSIPAGGTDATDGRYRREQRAEIRKPLAREKFVERRVVIDQGHKLFSNLSDIVATDGGAIGGVWRSNWKQPGYDYREDHKERDGKFYVIKTGWAFQRGLITKCDGFVDDITKPAEEPFCRCRYRFEYALRGVPREYLTTKGVAALAEARSKIKEMA